MNRSSRTRIHALALLLTLTACVAVRPATAQIPVTDIGAIVQLISQLQALEQQVETARQQLDQAQSEFRSITGGRGMERLLAGTVRNYLPSSWQDVQNSLVAGGGIYPGLAGQLQSDVIANAVLTDAQLAALPPDARMQLQADRSTVAAKQVLSREALVTTSERFASLQTLIDAISAAEDQKGILELQARIGAEQGMLRNEATKLELIAEVARADDSANTQRAREQTVAGHGQFSARFQPAP